MIFHACVCVCVCGSVVHVLHLDKHAASTRSRAQGMRDHSVGAWARVYARASMWRCGCASACACWHWHMLQVQGCVQGREDHSVGAWACVFVRVRVCGVAAVRVHVRAGTGTCCKCKVVCKGGKIIV